MVVLYLALAMLSSPGELYYSNLPPVDQKEMRIIKANYHRYNPTLRKTASLRIRQLKENALTINDQIQAQLKDIRALKKSNIKLDEEYLVLFSKFNTGFNNLAPKEQEELLNLYYLGAPSYEQLSPAARSYYDNSPKE